MKDTNSYFNSQNQNITNQSINFLSRILRIVFYSFTPILIAGIICAVLYTIIWSYTVIVIIFLIAVFLSCVLIKLSFGEIDKANVKIGLIIATVLAVVLLLVPIFISF